MKYKIVYYILLCIIISGCLDCDSNVTNPTPILHEPIYIPVNEDFNDTDEMDKLVNFLKEDKTDWMMYDQDPQRGISYFVCSGFTRTLAKNAKEYDIYMGGISLRNTPTVGVATKHYHAMNYVIINNQFMIIEPQTDQIFNLKTIKSHHGGVYKYITIYQDAQMMSNYGKGRQTIDIDLYSEYNESQIIIDFPPK